MIGYSFGRGGNDVGTGAAAEWLGRWNDPIFCPDGLFSFSYMIHDIIDRSPLDTLIALSSDLADCVEDVLRREIEPMLVIGGDHTSAIGTWQGAARLGDRFGLLWVDAHLDSHTALTSPSGNAHGMSLAILLGQGDQRLTRGLALNPEAVCVIGARDYEIEEPALLKRLGVRVFYDTEVAQRGIEAVTAEALDRMARHADHFGVSVDIDAIDVNEAPGVGCPSRFTGLSSQEVYAAIDQIRQSHSPIGWEIVEFNPYRDREHRTAQIVAQIARKIVTSTGAIPSTSNVIAA